MAWWMWLLAVTGAGMGPLVLGFLGWAFWKSTRPETDE